ncbi:hypothetical protein Tco_0088922 [Tanacetum coccineum]
MVISSPCLIDNKELTSPEQTAPAVSRQIYGKNRVSSDHRFPKSKSHLLCTSPMKPEVCCLLIKTIFEGLLEASLMIYGEVKINALFDLIISLPSHSPTPSTSHSPEPSTQHSPDNTTAAASQPSPTQPSPTHPSLGAEHHVPTPYDSPLHAVHSHGSDEGSLKLNELMNLVTKLSLIVFEMMKSLKMILGRISDTELQEKASTDTELFIQRMDLQLKHSRSKLSYAEAIRLEEQMNEEQRAQIARDEEIARQWDKEERQRCKWMNQVWDFNQNIKPMDAKHGSEKQKSPEKEKSPEKIVEEEVDTQEEMKEVVKEPGAKRKKSIPRKSTRKRQKTEEDAEKEELKGFLDIIPREEVPIEIMSKMLEDFDRLDVEELYRLVKERYSASRPEGFDLMLWGDLHTLFEPDEDNEIWKDQHEYKLLSWRLYDFLLFHILLMENGLAIHMLTEKKYPLSQEMISKMLKKKLEVDHESSQAIEFLRFIRSQVQK